MYNEISTIKELYCSNGKSIKDIATIIGRSISFVHGKLRRNGIKIRTVSQGLRLKNPSHIGRRFGKLSVISINNTIKNRKCVCLCDCGGKITVALKRLQSGGRKTCGCWQTSYKEIPGGLLYNIKLHAKIKGIPVKITPKFLWKLYLKQNRQCALSGIPIGFNGKTNTASVDRINSSIGYIPSNVQWLHKDVNSSKTDFAQERFIEIAIAIASRIKCQKLIDATKAYLTKMSSKTTPYEI